MKYEIQTGIKGTYTYTSLLKYYPVKYEVSQEYKDIRSFIYAFKNGITSKAYGATLSKMIIKDAFQPRNEWWACIIPASTKAKTALRFEGFCEEFSKGIQVGNGFNLISNLTDRDAIHSQADRNAVNIMDTLSFGDVKDKRIILIDDVFTTGKSFLKVANKLTELGALQVQGIFLGKTTWLD